MAKALRARFVFPVDRPAIKHGVVTIEGERIVSVDAKPQAGEVIDLGDVALLPGLVNCHTHLEFSDLRRPLGTAGMRLVDWIRLVIAERGRGDGDAGGAILVGLEESAFCGVAAIGDIVAGRTDNPVRRLVMDGQDCPSYGELDVTQFIEVIGFSRARAESAFGAVCERLGELAERTVARIGISPHAPYTVSPELLGKLISLASGRGMPVAMHLAESAEELELLTSGTGPFQELLEERSMWDGAAIPRGSRPMDYLRMLVEAPRAMVIHGNYLVEDEWELLAANADRMSLVYCPRTHAYFRHPPYPLAELLAKKVRMALGTDSRASNPDLNLWAEMRYVARAFPEIDPQEVLRMGTLAGAEALGREAELGSITPGKVASLVAMPLGERGDVSADDALSALLAGERAPSRVWWRGVEESV